MYRRLRLFSAWTLLSSVAMIGHVIPAAAQIRAQKFQYVVPRFSSNPGSELVMSNLSGRLATPEISFLDSNTLQFADTSVSIPAGTELRLTAASFGLSSFGGSVWINSANPISVVATLADGFGNFETVQSAAGSNTLIIPFAPGTGGNMDVTIFNPQPSTTTTLITAIASDGTPLGSEQRALPAFGTLTENITGLLTQNSITGGRQASFVIIKALTNILGPDRLLYASATVTAFSADVEGVIGPHFDPGVVNAIPVTSATTSSTIPFFVEGGDYITMLEVINTADTPASVVLTALAADGSPIDGTPTIQIAAGGSFRRNIQNIFTFGPGVRMGSITVQSSTPALATVALTSVAQNGFALLPATEPANTNFAFRTRTDTPGFFTGLTLRNSNASTATVTLVTLPDDRSGVSSETVTLAPFGLQTLPIGGTLGLLFISSDLPIFAQAVEGRDDNSILANLAPMHSQPDYVAPAQSTVFISGTVLHNNAALSGVSVQLSGTQTASTVTGIGGTYRFSNVVPGNYTVSVSKNGYTFNPASRSVTIVDSSRRSVDFTATIVTPTISLVQPSGVLAGSPATDIFVVGSPLIATSQIIFDGSPVTTSITSAGIVTTVTGATSGVSTVVQIQTVLKTTIPADVLATPRVVTVAIRNVGPGGSVTSLSLPFSIGTSPPTISALNGVPNPLLVGNPGFTFTVTGTGFTPGTSVLFQGAAIPTVFISDTQLQATVPPALLATSGVFRVSAIKPSPTIGPSNELTITVFGPLPGLTSISPISAEARIYEFAPPLAVTVQGYGFVKQSVVQIDGVDVPTEYHSSTELVGSIPQPQLEIARGALISVKNPDPVLAEGHFDSKLPLSLYNPAPTITSLDVPLLLWDPIPRFTGDPQTYEVQIVIHGTNFLKTGILFTSGAPVIKGASGPCSHTNPETAFFTGTRISSTLITGKATIGCTGQYDLVIGSLQPGGGLSKTFSFNVASYVAPTPVTVVGLQPASVLAGTTFDLTISGGNFGPGVVVNFGTAVLVPTAATSSSIVVRIPSFLVSTPGKIPVSVTNLNTTGNSNHVLLTVN